MGRLKNLQNNLNKPEEIELLPPTELLEKLKKFSKESGLEDETDKNNEAYRKTIEELVINQNDEYFKKLIYGCLKIWKEEIESFLEQNDHFELLAHSLHYKSPGFGRWFRWAVLTDEGKKIFVLDKTIYEVFDQKYLEIPEELNVSLENRRPFNKPVTLQTKKGQDKIKIAETINLTEKIRDIESFLAEISLSRLIDYGRVLLKEEKPNGTTLLQDAYIGSKLRKCFNIGSRKKQKEEDIKNAIRLLISGYIVFRSAPKITENSLQDGQLLIYIFPLRGPVSANQKQGSWLIFLRKKNSTTNTDKTLKQPLEKRIMQRWSLVFGADVNAAVSVSRRYWSLDVQRLINELVTIDAKIALNENNLIKSIGRQFKEEGSLDYEENKEVEEQSWPCEVKKKLKVMIGHNRNYIDLLDRIRVTAKSGEIKKDSNSKPNAKVISIFLHSEPGTGKETLAFLIYLWSRALLSTDQNKIDWKKQLWDTFCKNQLGEQKRKNPFKQNITPGKLDEIICDSFFTVNCSLLNRGNFQRLLFGSKKRPEGVLKAGLRSGACFFDEFNTIDKTVENNFLRLLEDPYEGLVYEKESKDSTETAIKKLKCVYIFASNKSPDEMIEEGHNSAVISRIAQYTFRILPLRERKEDLLLAFIKQLGKLSKQPGDEVAWEKVDRNALSFIAMLPWTDNFRALNGFVNDLFNDRRKRMITNKVISLQEVIECAIRRNILD